MIGIDNILDVEKYIDGLAAVIFDLDDTLYSEKEYIRRPSPQTPSCTA